METEGLLAAPDETVQRMQRRFRVALGAFLFVLVLALTPWTRDPAGDIKRLILGVASAGMVMAWLAASWRLGVPVRRPRIALELLLGLLIFLAIGTLRSPFPGVSMTQLGYFASLFLLYFVASQVYIEARHVNGLLMTLCAAMACATAYAFLQKVGWDPFPWTDRQLDVYTNLPGTFGNPNYAAHALILAIVIAIYFGARPDTRWGLGLALAFAVHQVFTDQRAGLIALAAAGVLLVSARISGYVIRGPIGRTVAGIALAVAVGIAAVSGYMLQNKARHEIALPLDGSLLLRYNGYLNAAAMALDKPLLGHGPGVYALRTPEYWTTFEQQWFAQEQRMNEHVHNDLLELAVDGGMPAAGLYLSALLLMMAFGLLLALSAPPGDRRKLGYMFAALFMVFLVDGLFGFNLRVPVSASVLFLMFGALEGLWAGGRPATVPARVPGAAGRIWRFGMAGAALFVAIWSINVFVSELCHHSGLRAHYEVLRVVNAPIDKQRDMDPERARSFVSARAAQAREAFKWGERLAPWNHIFAGRMGEADMALRDFDRAVTDLERALALNPYYIPTLARLGNAKLTLAQSLIDAAGKAKTVPEAAVPELLDDAQEYADQIANLCAMYPGAEDLKGRIANARATYLGALRPPAERAEIAAQWNAAEKHFETAIQLGARNHIDIYRLLAQLRKAKGDRKGEEEALVRAVQANPSDELMWRAFFDYTLQAKPSDRLRSTLYLLMSHISALDPPKNDALGRGYMVLAKYHAQEKDFSAADAAYENAVRVGSERADIWTAFAQYANRNDRLPLYEAKLNDAAAEAVSAQVISHPALAVGFLLLAEIRETKQADIDGAEAAFVRAVRFGPDRADVWANYANFARKNDRLGAFKETLESSCTECMANGPVPLVYVRAVCDVLEKGGGALDVATDALLRQFREYPEDNKRLMTVHLGWAAQLMLEEAVAAQAAGKTLCLTYLNLGIVLAGMDQFAAAETLFPPAMQCLEGENVAIAGTHWADVLQRSGRSDAAQNLLNDLVARFPETLMVRWAYAQLLAKTERVPEAVQEYDAILAFPFLQPSERQRIQAERTALLQAPAVEQP